MERFADLHIHTTFSDGSLRAEEVVRYAKSHGISAIAITDHDTCLGIAPAIISAKDLDIEVIPGIELSTELDDEEVHILGYFIDWKDRLFGQRLQEFSKVREERAKEILKKLRKYNISLSEEELFKLSGSGSICRLHIAHLLVKKGYVSSIKEAFTKYIGNKGSCYVKKFKLSPKDAISMVKSVNGLSVLAHAKTINITNISTQEIVKILVDDGIQGLEVYHIDHKAKDKRELEELAKKYNLLITGGSDCHGLRKKQVLIGKVKIPYKLVEEMKKCQINQNLP